MFFDTHPQVTPRHNSNRPSSLHSCQTVPSTDKQASPNLSLGDVVFLSPCRSSRHKPPSHTYKSTADDTRPLKTPQTTFRQADALTCRQVFFFSHSVLSHEILPWRLVFQIRSLPPNMSSSSSPSLSRFLLSLSVNMWRFFPFFFQSYDYCVTPSVWCRLALCL